MTVTQPGTRPVRTAETQARLLEAAAEVFAEKGYKGAGVQEIARRAGLTTGAIYSRYSGKAELLLEAFDATSSRELDELFRGRRSSDDSAAEVLATVGSHLVTRERDQGSALLLEAFVTASRDPDFAERLRAHVEERARLLGEIVEAAKDEGTMAESLDTRSIVRFCHALGLGFLLLEAVDLTPPAAGPWQDLITRLVAALGDEPPTPDNEERE